MKVLIYPFDTNPYQRFLYTNLDKIGVSSHYLYMPTNSLTINRILWYFQILYFRLNGYTIFHLHWLQFGWSFDNKIFQFISFINSICSLFWIKILGFKLVWTVHNLIPHEQQTTNDLFITKIVSFLADAVIIHSSNTLLEFHKLNITTEKMQIVPVGNYMNYYPNTLKRNKARNILGIQENFFVYLFFGKIRKYKGISKLLKTFSHILTKVPNSILIIAGDCDDKSLSEQLILYKNILKEHLIIRSENILDNDLQLLFQASDIAVFPFEKLTTTSSVLTSFFFNRPVITPRIGNIVDFPDETGIFYDSEDSLGLEKSMIKAYNEKSKLNKFNETIQKYNNSLSWSESAKKTLKLYEGL